jgi:hypothetical protein
MTKNELLCHLNNSAKKYDDDDAFHVENHADYTGDELDAHPAIRELQEASRAVIPQAIRQPCNSVVKVAMLGPPKSKVRGYVTLARFLQGATTQQFERMLGFRDGVLSNGCVLYYVDAFALTADNIGPRYFSSWSAGVSPRDLQRVSEEAGADIKYHRNYPVASNPISQFVIFQPVRVLLSCIFTTLMFRKYLISFLSVM